MSNLIQATAARRPVVVDSGTGYGVEFNVSASPQFLTAPIPAGIAGATEYCFALWLKRVGDFGTFISNPMIFGFTVDGGSTSSGAGLARDASVQGAVLVSTGDGQANTNMTTGDLPLNEWVHIAGVRQSDGVARMVVNGVTVQSVAGEVTAMGSDLSGMDLTIGAARDGSRPIPLQASNLQVWNIALSDQEVQDWCMPRLTGTLPTGLIFYAPL